MQWKAPKLLLLLWAVPISMAYQSGHEVGRIRGDTEARGPEDEQFLKAMIVLDQQGRREAAQKAGLIDEESVKVMTSLETKWGAIQDYKVIQRITALGKSEFTLKVKRARHESEEKFLVGQEWGLSCFGSADD